MSKPESSRHMGSVDRVVDLVDSVKKYARQETLGPLKGAGRWLAFGAIGALLLGTALLLAVVGVLRLSQDLGGNALDGSWSFVHYVVAVVFNLVLVYIAMSRIGQTSLEKEK
ncbi:MAG: hypothetical protein EXQ63_00580 [Ilumatobacteraceae bacterium]|nr:hypothetical protein [Ilumatobacteraceae bacterium]